MKMRSIDEEGEDAFFDTRSYLDSASSESSAAEIEESVLEKFEYGEYGVWAREPMSVDERRDRFLRESGLDVFMSAQFSFSDESEEMERATESSSAALDSLTSPDYEGGSEYDCCIKDLDSGKRFVFQDLGEDCSFSMVREVGSDRLFTFQEFEALIGLSCSTQLLTAPSREKHDQRSRHLSWWRSLSTKRHRMGMCKSNYSSVEKPKSRPRIVQRCKSCSQSTALNAVQEIQAHKGSIWAMKFSPSGLYLASGGEDCILRVWQVGEVEGVCKCFIMNNSFRGVDKIECKKAKLGGKAPNPNAIVIPEKVFKIKETPLQEFHGHTSDILDLSWSNADYLITSSKDKTVRMWEVGCTGCLKVFQHKDYVTCIQFNPVDDRYFISGSIDGKIRIWGISESRVVDWVDIRDIVTAICYRPDGKGFVVGSITGSCRSYYYSDNSMQLGSQFCVQGKKKSAGKRITGLKFSPEDPERIMVTSADSKVRIFDGVDVIHKFLGLRRTKSHSSASFTSDGKYIVSVGEDSNVYVWHYNAPGSSAFKGAKTKRASEHFFSEGVTIALPWPGIDHTGGGLCDDIFSLSSPVNILDPSTWLKDSGSCYLGTLLLLDGLSTKSPTWPEEKLSALPSPVFEVDYQADKCHVDLRPRHLKSLATQGLVIVTASSEGSIRCFHNYGLPVRL